MTVTMGFVGMILVYQGCTQAQRILGDMSLIGPGFLQLVVREFGPTIGAMMLATRVGAGIAAEVGSMKVTEQIEAIRMCGADPVEMLAAPRFVACMVATVVLAILGSLIMYAIGGLTAHVAFGVSSATFFSTRLVRPLDVINGFSKIFVFGAIIPLVAMQSGLNASGSSEGVGAATTRTVIEASLLILMFDVLIGSFYFLLGQRTGFFFS